MLKKDDIKRIIKNHLVELHRDYAVAQIGLFGAYAQNEQTPQSDVDILVQFSTPVGFIAFMELEAHLQQLLGAKIDLVTPAALKPRSAASVLEEVDYVQ